MMTAGLEPAPAASSKGTGTLPPFVTPRGGNGSGGGGDYPTRLRAALRVREQSIRGHDGGEHEEEGEEGDFLARWPRSTWRAGGAVGGDGGATRSSSSSGGGAVAAGLSSAAAAAAADHGRSSSNSDDDKDKRQDLTAAKAGAGVRRGAMPVAPTKGAPPLELLQPSPAPQHDGRQQEQLQQEQKSNNEKEFLLPRNVFALADELYLDVLDGGAQQARERKEDLEIIHMSASEVVRAIVGASDEKEGLGGAGAKRRSSSRLTSERALRAVARRAVHAQQLVSFSLLARCRVYVSKWTTASRLTSRSGGGPETWCFLVSSNLLAREWQGCDFETMAWRGMILDSRWACVCVKTKVAPFCLRQRPPFLGTWRPGMSATKKRNVTC